MTIIRIILFFILAVFQLPAMCQNKCPKGDKAYDKLQFHKASEAYEKCIKSSFDPDIAAKLADCYHILGKTAEASVLYEKIIQFPDMDSTKVKKFRSLLNKQSSGFSDSKTFVWFDNNNQPIEKKFTVTPVSFNSAFADFSPTFFKNGIVYSSARPAQKAKDHFTGQFFTNLYFFDPITLFSSPLSEQFYEKYNIGTSCFTENEQNIYFTGNDLSKNQDKVLVLKIMSSTYKDGHWSKPTDFQYNTKNHHVGHPAISPNGKWMVFSSNLEKSSDLDLFICEHRAGQWSIPVRLPSPINSSGNEAFPVFINDSLLIYSSDFMGTLGGLDMMAADFRKGQFTNKRILPAPFNSPYDDYGLITKDNFQSGYFTSTRGNEEGIENIYYFETAEELLAETNESESKYESILEAEIIVSNNPETPADSTPRQKITEESIFITEENKTILPDSFVIENLFYDFDKWNIRPDAALVLDNLAEILLQKKNLEIELESHTDSRGNDQYNLILSQKRADSAVVYLKKKGVDVTGIKAIGAGESRLANHCKNDIPCSARLHQQNRRTVVRIIKQ
ncbi:MAG: OmpA family protein [Saprospiraceae bacterium]|nr:OmpA family protein [Saprospiraceae bacterium]